MDFLVEITGYVREMVHPHFLSLYSSHVFYYKDFFFFFSMLSKQFLLIMPSFLTFSRSDIIFSLSPYLHDRLLIYQSLDEQCP